MDNNKNKISRLAKYSGLAFQLLAFIGVGYFIGNWVDTKWKSDQAYGTAFFATIFLLLGLVYVIRDILREDKS
jgi:membrane protein DedA with SNARE-associated domain